ncbi:MAG TPA: hypothetical protein VNA12_07540 [Mycobacteriales bacterium]|nr:hypothetical protein [Mycobacteriales bacterium]
MSQPTFDPSDTAEPSAESSEAAAPKSSGGRSPAQMLALALVVVVLLGGTGMAGLYLTRDPKGPS